MVVSPAKLAVALPKTFSSSILFVPLRLLMVILPAKVLSETPASTTPTSISAPLAAASIFIEPLGAR